MTRCRLFEPCPLMSAHRHVRSSKWPRWGATRVIGEVGVAKALLLKSGPHPVRSLPVYPHYFSTLANDIVAGQTPKPAVANAVQACGGSTGSTSLRSNPDELRATVSVDLTDSVACQSAGRVGSQCSLPLSGWLAK